MIRQARGGKDLAWIRETATAAYAPLGDYHATVEAWIGSPGVFAFVDDEDDRPRGFSILGFFLDEEGRPTAELLALAVAPGSRGVGVGRALLEHTIEFCRRSAVSGRVGELRLTVAVDNDIGRRLYARSGFLVIDEHHGHYDGGQRAIRMARRLAG